MHVSVFELTHTFRYSCLVNTTIGSQSGDGEIGIEPKDIMTPLRTFLFSGSDRADMLYKERLAEAQQYCHQEFLNVDTRPDWREEPERRASDSATFVLEANI